MGQGGSTQHSPLTFGYVEYSRTSHAKEKADVNTSSEGAYDNILVDYVLNHPELYKLETLCKCSNSTMYNNSRTIASTTNNYSEESLATTEQQTCRTCQPTKRMSFVRHHLVKDLEYIDETYYADIKHYEYAPDDNTNSTLDRNQLLSTNGNVDNYHHDNNSNDNNNNDDDYVNENWDKITMGQVTSQAPRHSTTLPGAKDHQGGGDSRLSSFTLNLSGRYLVKLSSGIGYLGNLTKLNLSNNQLSTLPKSIGYLSNLTVLNTAHNQLETLPDTMVHLTKLKAMNICHNSITHLPPCLGFLPELIIIIANNNQLGSIPNELANLQQMVSLNVSNNPLSCLPAEIANIKSLRKLIAEECDFKTEFINKRHHDPPSLFEQCARTIVQQQLALPSQLPDHIRNYLSTHQACSYCHGPYFESFVTRGRFIERAAGQPIALEYRLCQAHWSDDQDRLLDLFSSSSSVAGRRMSSLGDGVNGSNGVADSSPTLSSGGALKRSASSSSNISLLYRTLPSLPLLPSLNTCPGSNNTPSLSAKTSASHNKGQLGQQPQQFTHRPRQNSFAKRVARILSPSKTNSSISSDDDIRPSTQHHSLLHQEITTTSINPAISTTAGLKESSIQESIRSPDDEQSIYHHHQHDVQHQHMASSSSFHANDNNL